ncbi:MAG: flagellar basal body P-ring formation chaperone FlgA [Planctomycetota bacterium]
MAHTKPNLTRRWLLFALLTLLLVVWAVGMASGQSVHLKRQAAVDASRMEQRGGVTLGDLAELIDFSEAETRALRSLVIVPVGESKPSITLSEVRTALRHAGVNLGMLTLRGFAVCELRFENIAEAAAAVEPMPVSVSATPNEELRTHTSLLTATTDRAGAGEAATLRQLIQTRITAALDLPADQIVCIFDGRDDATLNQSTLGATFEVQPIGDVRLGRMNVRVTRTAGFGETESNTVGVRVGWKTQVLTATRDIARHERLSASNVALTEVTIDRNLDGELFTLDAIRGASAASALRAGQPLRQEDLGRPTLVKRGQAVTVQVRRGNFEMTTTAFADHDAALHEPVTLRNEARPSRDTKTFRGYVTGPARVTVRPEKPANSSESPQLAHGG